MARFNRIDRNSSYLLAGFSAAVVGVFCIDRELDRAVDGGTQVALRLASLDFCECRHNHALCRHRNVTHGIALLLISCAGVFRLATVGTQMEIYRCILIGAESTGKTELAQALAQLLPAAWSCEYVRTFIETHRRAVQITDLEMILAGQLANEQCALQQAAKQGWRWVVYDSNCWMTTLYARELYGVSLPLPPASYCGDNCLYLLCEPDIPWSPDPGQRDGPATRTRFHQLFAAELLRCKIPFVRIKGLGANRCKNALAACCEWTASKNHQSKNSNE
jgi:nicotinamide riboside kinase